MLKYGCMISYLVYDIRRVLLNNYQLITVYFVSLHDPIEDASVITEHQAKLLELKSNWLDFINKYECTMTVEEINEYMMGNGN